MRPRMLDPERDLKGATPETLARALFRRTEPLRPSTRRKAVFRNKVTVKKPVADKPGNGGYCQVEQNLPVLQKDSAGSETENQ